MDNDLTEYVLWPKLPGIEEFLFHLFTSYKSLGRKRKRKREVKSRSCERRKWSREVFQGAMLEIK